jgi:acetyl esterase/lipase
MSKIDGASLGDAKASLWTTDRSRGIGLVLTVWALAVVLAACGTSSDGGDESTTADPGATTEPTTTQTTAPSTVPPTTTTRAATTTQVTTTTTAAPTTTLSAVAVSVLEGVPYRESEDGRPSIVDMYVPDTALGRPAVVLLHGWGAPRGRPQLELTSLAEEIARLGATVFYFRWHTSGLTATSAADLACIGGFVSARAAEYGADPERVVVVGHSMGGEAGAMLGLSAFGPTPGSDCVERGPGPVPYAVLGIAGGYGLHSRPLDEDLTMFAVRRQPADVAKEIAADEEVAPGLTAIEAYRLSGYGVLPPSNLLRVVLLVGDEDTTPGNESRTQRFAEALRSHGIDVEVVIVPDADHADVTLPTTDGGQATLGALRSLLDGAP